MFRNSKGEILIFSTVTQEQFNENQDIDTISLEVQDDTLDAFFINIDLKVECCNDPDCNGCQSPYFYSNDVLEYAIEGINAIESKESKLELKIAGYELIISAVEKFTSNMEEMLKEDAPELIYGTNQEINRLGIIKQ